MACRPPGDFVAISAMPEDAEPAGLFAGGTVGLSAAAMLEDFWAPEATLLKPSRIRAPELAFGRSLPVGSAVTRAPLSAPGGPP